MAATLTPTVRDRARCSAGASSDPVHQMVRKEVLARHPGGGSAVDVGCGRGDLFAHIGDRFDTYTGADVVHYDELKSTPVRFVEVDLDTGRVPLDSGAADVVIAAETIEHLENPRAFARELTRLAKPGGLVIITTPNQLSLLAKLGLVLLGEFPAFRGGNYPAHLTALLEVDLRRIAAECGLSDLAVRYSGKGRMPGTGRKWPGLISRLFPRSFSDNILISGRRPALAGPGTNA